MSTRAQRQRAEVLVVDPPWPQRKGSGGRRAVRPQQLQQLDYPTMSVSECFSSVDQLLSDAKVVFLWEIDKFLIEAESEMTKRGWRRHARLVWGKGNGVAPAFTVRFSHEYLVWWFRSPMMPIDSSLQGHYTTVFRSPSREHSRKPEEAYSLIEKLYPHAIRMDVFSREPRMGWLQWGNQTEHFKRASN